MSDEGSSIPPLPSDAGSEKMASTKNAFHWCGWTVASEALIQGFQRLQTREKMADFKIKCGDESWMVHSSVLVIHSNVLAKMCTSGFKESEERYLDLVDEEPEIVALLVEFLYEFTYKTEALSLIHHLKLAVLADKWEITTLRSVTTGFFCEEMEVQKKYIEGLVQAAEYVYEFPTVLKPEREAVIQHAAGNRVLSGGFRSLVRKVPELSIDIVDAVAKKFEGIQNSREDHYYGNWRGEDRFFCPDCDMEFVAKIPRDDMFYRENIGWGGEALATGLDVTGKKYACFWCKKEMGRAEWHATRHT